MKKLLLSAAFIAASFTSIAQVGINTVAPQGTLDVVSVNDTGLVLPRVSSLDAVTDGGGNAPVNGTAVYAVDIDKACFYINTKWICLNSNGTTTIEESTPPNPITMAYIKPPYLDSNDQFGLRSVISDDGNTIAVVSRNDSSSAAGIFSASSINASNAGNNSLASAGSVYVFSRANNTVDFAVEAYIKNANPTAADVFGFRGLLMSGDGNTLVVGSVKGVAYIFTRSGTTWTERQSVTKNDGSGDRFTASAISQDGTTIAFGAERADSSAVGIDPSGDGSDGSSSNTGEVFIYVRSGNTWSQQAYIKPSQVNASDGFTASTLSSDGDILIAKSGGYDATVSNGGAIFVFRRNNAGVWTESQIIQAPNVSTNDGGSITTSLSGDGLTLAIGMRQEGSGTDAIISASGTIPTDETASSSGAVYIYNYSGSQFVFETYIKAPNAEVGDFFGQGVALTTDGNKLFVSSLGDDSDANGVFLSGDSGYAAALADNSATSEAGAVYVFKRSAGIWTAAAFIKAENSDGSDRFSTIMVTSNGNTLIVGAIKEQSNSTTIGAGQSDNSITGGAGAVYVIDVSGI
jgi:hypothetical protein